MYIGKECPTTANPYKRVCRYGKEDFCCKNKGGGRALLLVHKFGFSAEMGCGHCQKVDTVGRIQTVEYRQQFRPYVIRCGISIATAEEVNADIREEFEKRRHTHIADGISPIEIIGNAPLRNSGTPGKRRLCPGPAIGFSQSLQYICFGHFLALFAVFFVKIPRGD